MKKAVFIFTFGFFLSFSNIVRCQDKPGTCTTYDLADEKSSCVVMRMKGARGVWLPLERSEMLRIEHSVLIPELQSQLSVRQGQLAKALESADLLKAALEEHKTIQATLELHLEQSRQAEAKAVEKLNSWFRQPLVWFGAGVVIGAMVTLAVTR